jgi:hypothetical protein
VTVPFRSGVLKIPNRPTLERRMAECQVCGMILLCDVPPGAPNRDYVCLRPGCGAMVRTQYVH